jgi:hypothetical protein
MYRAAAGGEASLPRGAGLALPVGAMPLRLSCAPQTHEMRNELA